MRRLSVLLALACAGGCAYGFEDDNAVFACKDTGDCADDHLCGNHSLADNEAFSICTTGERVPAVGLRVKLDVLDCPAFDPNADANANPVGTWEANLTWGTTVSNNVDSVQSTDVGCDGSDNARDGGSTPCCIGGPQEENSGYRGRGSVLCFLPAADLAAATENDRLQVALVLNYSVGGLSKGNAQSSGLIPTGADAPIVWSEALDWGGQTSTVACD